MQLASQRLSARTSAIDSFRSLQVQNRVVKKIYGTKVMMHAERSCYYHFQETGGMALVQVLASTGSIHLSIVFNGNFLEHENVLLKVRISGSDSDSDPVEESVNLKKINYYSNSFEIKSILESSHLRSLSRGKLFIYVFSPKNPDFKLKGYVRPR